MSCKRSQQTGKSFLFYFSAYGRNHCGYWKYAQNCFKPHAAVIRDFHFSVPAAQVPIQHNPKEKLYWILRKPISLCSEGCAFFPAKGYPQSLAGIGTNGWVIPESHLNSSSALECSREGVCSEKGTRMLKGRSRMEVKIWSWPRLAIASRE